MAPQLLMRAPAQPAHLPHIDNLTLPPSPPEGLRNLTRPDSCFLGPQVTLEYDLGSEWGEAGNVLSQDPHYLQGCLHYSLSSSCIQGHHQVIFFAFLTNYLLKVCNKAEDRAFALQEGSPSSIPGILYGSKYSQV